ncbi:MAG: tRNA pseudouridine(55) synthase TruB [Thermodesulfobacteriota bacterium]|nr:tRNA pseudouridine(55) synthase TruB [Thermodesulfobacteriota bacterium]
MTEQPDGIIVVNKPAGITSAKVVALVKRHTGARKVGHAGTLDPFATGVLVCLINRATRLAEFFLASDKTYAAVMCLGTETDTQDLTGTVTATCDTSLQTVSDDAIRRVMASFEGESVQRPPAFSAVKHQGVPLYRLARQGVHVEKPARPVVISSLTVQEICRPMVRFEVTCSSGTYIRTLCADMGRALGCGGHLYALERTRAGGFDLARAVDLEHLADLCRAGKAADLLVPMSEALSGMPRFTAPPALAGRIAAGGQLTAADFTGFPAADAEGYFQVTDDDGRLLAVVQRHEKIYRYRCVLAG